MSSNQIKSLHAKINVDNCINCLFLKPGFDGSVHTHRYTAPPNWENLVKIVLCIVSVNGNL